MVFLILVWVEVVLVDRVLLVSWVDIFGVGRLVDRSCFVVGFFNMGFVYMYLGCRGSCCRGQWEELLQLIVVELFGFGYCQYVQMVVQIFD